MLYSDADAKRSGWELVFVYGIVWLAALARVVYLLARHEGFGIEASLAALAVIGLPILAARSLMDVKET